MLPNTGCAARSNGRSSRTPLDGSHGLFRVPGYVASVRSGKVTAGAEPKVERLAPGVIKVDGFNGFAPLPIADAQLPFGGYKGASIALMIQLLAGALVGDLFSFESSEVDPGDGGPSRDGELVLDPE